MTRSSRCGAEIIWCLTRRHFRMLETSGDGTIRSMTSMIPSKMTRLMLLMGNSVVRCPMPGCVSSRWPTSGLALKYEVAQPNSTGCGILGCQTVPELDLNLDPASANRSRGSVCYMTRGFYLGPLPRPSSQRHSHVSSTEFCRERSMAFVPCPPLPRRCRCTALRRHVKPFIYQQVIARTLSTVVELVVPSQPQRWMPCILMHLPCHYAG